MKFKEIKPGMVIHCPKEKDADALLKHLTSIGYAWDDKFECNCGNQYAGWNYYGSDTCFGTGQDSRIIVWSRLQTWQKAGLEITEFSNLIEPDDISDWYEEMESDSPMTAVKVLEWFHNVDADTIYKVFGISRLDEALAYHEPNEIIQRIKQYEAAKKAPKPVEVEWVKLFRIIQIQDNGTKKCVYEEEVGPYVAYGMGEEGNYSFDPKYGAENVLKRYVSEHDGRYIAVIEDICRVKEGES